MDYWTIWTAGLTISQTLISSWVGGDSFHDALVTSPWMGYDWHGAPPMQSGSLTRWEEPWSEQRQPLYYGLRPATLMRLQPETPSDSRDLQIREELRWRAENELPEVLRRLEIPSERRSVEIEAWPARNDIGRQVWTYARWRTAGAKNWNWFSTTEVRKKHGRKFLDEMFFPRIYRPSNSAHEQKLFDDFLLLDDLYEKPYFGDCVWTDEEGKVGYGAWMPPRYSANLRPDLRDGGKYSDRVCRWMPQPPRLNGYAFSVVIRVRGDDVQWPDSIEWIKDPELPEDFENSDIPTIAWPKEMKTSYEWDVKVITGELPAALPDGRQIYFERKSSAQPDHQLDEMVDYLEARYADLGIQTVRQRFTWRGIPQSNLIAVLPGSDRSLPAVILGDHIDTAFAQKHFADSGERVSVPGADDNATAVGALLQAAEILKGQPHRSDIWLVHLTGEEFPSDGVGTRYFITEAMENRRRIAGTIIWDMIGYRQNQDPIMQINPGESPESLEMAVVARVAALRENQTTVPVIRTRFSDKSYLYNTDAIFFSELGSPVILLNEHINAYENLTRDHYHELTDTTSRLDWDYALSIVKVGITTAAWLAR